MMPGLVLSSATSSTSRAAERGAFPKPFVDRVIATAHEAAPSKARRLVQQAIRLQSRPLSSAAEVPKICGARRNSNVAERGLMSECGSSGSNHEPSSVCLAAMVDEFIEDESCACVEGDCTSACSHSDLCSMGSSEGALAYAATFRLMQSLAACRDDQECKLRKDVEEIVERSNSANGAGSLRLDGRKKVLPRLVMSALRKVGYDAGVCKTRWDHSSGIPGGDYEYIDVLIPSNDRAARPVQRLLIDVEFRAQFEIARPTSEFSALLQQVPLIFIGMPESLLQIVQIMAEATKRSLPTMGLHLPPWRKLSYMKAKWFLSYKRTSKSLEERPQKQSVLDGDNGVGEFVGIAKRGSGLDSRCTKELELLYHGVKHERPTDGLLRKKKRQSNVITVTSTDWQFPALEMRSPASPPRERSGQKVTGLASMFLQAGALASNSTIVAKAA